MQRVASLYLPHWAIERLRRAERRASPPERGDPASLEPIAAAMAAEHARGCSVPRGGGWRPGARWARQERQAAIAALPAHQRPPMSELGRSDEVAANPFRAMRPDEGGAGASRQWLAVPHVTDPSDPCITSQRTGNRLEIAAACPAARALGLMPGMAVAQARAVVKGLDIRPADPMGDAADLHRLAMLAARRWSPLVAVAGADSLFIDLSGVAHLFGGETMMAWRIVRLLRRLGFTARIAIADTPGASWALAHFSGLPVSHCPPGRQAEALADLPTEALRIDAAAIELLKRLGVDTIGQTIALPRAPLIRRFGQQVALRIDQALGHIAQPIDPVIPPNAICVERRFAEPIASAEAITHHLALLVPELARGLEAEGLGARMLELVAARVDGCPQRIRIGLARPNRDPAHLLRLLERRIDAIAPGYGIDAMTVHVRRAEPLGPEPLAARIDAEDEPDVATLVDTLATRIGISAMWRHRPLESDVPERAVGRMPLLDAPRRGMPRAKQDDIAQLQRNPALHPWHPDWPKPARLLVRPERLDHVLAELPDHAPRRFTWRGTAHSVIRADGPERVHGEWWRHSAERYSVRDYFRVEDEQGRRYWLFRRGDGERPETGDLSWYLHGCFG